MVVESLTSKISKQVRAVGYFRVSTDKQVAGDLSIPDQRRQVAQFCQGNEWSLLAEYVEDGLTATDDNRPVFQQMIERATDDDRPFDVILVHSYSRFFRDGFQLEMYVRKLAKAKVRLVSITQPLGDDPVQAMMRQMIGLFDEYQSKEISKHVRRGMMENARQGFWNGSPPPLGYSLQEVERRGDKIKKKLVIDPIEAELVSLIFHLYKVGSKCTGPMGIKAIVSHLNTSGYRTRKGGYFGTSAVHRILTNPTYCGEFIYNKVIDTSDGVQHSHQAVIMPVPLIIQRDYFDEVQKSLHERDPKVTPPRIVTGPILLTGLAFCGKCGAAMSLRTGTSRNGKVHNYYSCGAAKTKGAVVCAAGAIAMPVLDELVVDHLQTRLFTPERIQQIIYEVSNRRSKKAAEVDGRISELKRKSIAAEERLGRLYRSIEDGIVPLDDILRNKVIELQTDRQRAQKALERIQETVVNLDEISDDTVEAFAKTMCENIRDGAVPFRKAYIRSVVERIDVNDDVVCITGSNAVMESAVRVSKMNIPPVRSFEPSWHALGESNPSFQNENLTS